MGDGLGKTTGWIHRTVLKIARCRCSPASSTCGDDDAGLHIQVGDQQQCLPVDQVIICAGQEPLKELQAGLQAAGKPVRTSSAVPTWPPSWMPNAPSGKGGAGCRHLASRPFHILTNPEPQGFSSSGAVLR